MKRNCATALLSLTLAVCSLQSSPRGARMPLRPVNLDKLNTPKDEDDPCLSADRLRLYYASNASGRFTLMATERKSPLNPWPAGKEVQGPAGEGDDRSPFLTADHHDLYYATRFVVKNPNKDTKEFPDNFDLVHSINVGKGANFTAGVPVQSMCTPDDELHPWVTADGRELYFSRKTKDGWRVFVARRPGKTGAFADSKLVEGLPPGYHHAALSRDSRTVYLQGPLEGGRWGLFRATRAAASAPWEKPEPLEDLNSPEAPTGDVSPSLTHDGTKLYFASDRPGGKGGRDLWVIDTVLLGRVK